MEMAITKMSQNGQVVIPAGVRKEAGVGPSTKFIVFSRNGNIMFKQIKKDDLLREIALIEKVRKGESDIQKGKSAKADTKMSDEEIVSLLMS